MIRLCGACDGDGVNPEERDIPCRECDGAGVKETDGAVDYPQQARTKQAQSEVPK